MKAIIGLGNPGAEFTFTRHNVGYDVIKKISKCIGMPINKIKGNSLIGSGRFCGEKVILVLPLSYMNLIGSSVKEFFSNFDIKRDEVLFVLDDINLKIGNIRIREKGSDGGHNGLKSIIFSLKTTNFARLRIGIGPKPLARTLSDYVLKPFKKSERKIVDSSIDIAVEAVMVWLRGGINAAMNKFNKVNA